MADLPTTTPDVPGTDIVEQTVSESLQQHPIHAMIGRTFDRLGGEDWFHMWAEENEDKFVSIMVRLAPVSAPKGLQGGVHLHIHEGLGAGPLDGGLPGVTIDGEAEIVPNS